jgi:hypothetical protein
MASEPVACLAKLNSIVSKPDYLGTVQEVECVGYGCPQVEVLTSTGATVLLPEEFDQRPIPVGTEVFRDEETVCLKWSDQDTQCETW